MRSYSRGDTPEDMVPLRSDQRVLGYTFTYGMRRLEEWKRLREVEMASRAPATSTD